MSTTYISAELRRLVIARAELLCEYCLIHEEDTYLGCEIDHIISEKHGGPTIEDNLAYACMICNRNKGSDVGSIVSLQNSSSFSRFFNPRIDLWYEHFQLSLEDRITILPISDIGEVTVRIFKFNEYERLLERQTLRDLNRYPTTGALQKMTKIW